MPDGSGQDSEWEGECERDPQPQVAPTFPREVGLATSGSEERREARCAASGKRSDAGRVRVKAGAQPLARWAFRLRLSQGQRGSVGRQHTGLALAGQGEAGAGSLWA